MKLFIAAVVMLFVGFSVGIASEFTEEELNAATAARTLAIKNAAAKVSALEDRHKQPALPVVKQDLMRQIKDAKREYNSIKKRTIEEFAEEARKPKDPDPTEQPAARPKLDDNPFGNPFKGPFKDAPPILARETRRPRTVEEVLADVEAKRKAKAEAMRGLTVRFPYSKVWAPRNDAAIEFGICQIFFDGEPPTQGFFKIGDKTEQVAIESSDTAIALPMRDDKHTSGPYFFLFKKPGEATLTVRVGPYSVSHKIEVAMAPVAPRDKTDFVIGEMGLPSHKQSIFVKWPKTEFHDGFMYEPKAGEPFNGEHWWFDSHRDLILSIEAGEVLKLGTNRRRTDSQVELRAELPNGS